MSEIKSAYRFIPVKKEQEYYSPKWRNDVSQDIPFSDGVSGSIKYTIKAATPIFVKGEDGKFCNIQDKYYIPGTTLKGCFRSVMEILSFGHLDETRVENSSERFSLRDIQDQNGYMKKMASVYCGWLTDDGTIVKWGKPFQLRYTDYQKFGVKERKFEKYNFRTKKNEIITRLVGDFVSKDALSKYKTYKYIEDFFSDPAKLSNTGPFDKRLFVKPKVGGNKGTIIFSGSMQNKKSDFVLLEKDESKSAVLNAKGLLADFHRLNPNYDKIPFNESKGGRAVFFTKNEKDEVLTIGLSYLHKYYSQNNVRNAIPSGMQGGTPDMADLIFGSVKYNLKGRVQFGPAMQCGDATTLIKEGESFLAVLGSPHASYYPTYLQHSATWDTNGALISGIKRYPIKPNYDISAMEMEEGDRRHYTEKFGNLEGSVYEPITRQNGKKIIPRDVTNHELNFETITRLNPLKEGCLFEGIVYFHNLKRVELGALLSAMTFHGKEDSCKHSIGQAKSYGYGSVSISIKEISTADGNTKETYLKEFEELMNSQMLNLHASGTKWLESTSVKELFALAKGFSEESLIDTFTHMMLEEFGKMKGRDFKTGEYKNSFSLFSSIVTASNTSTQHQPKKNNVAKARVTLLGQIKQAKLLEGKHANQSKSLIVDKAKLKVGDEVEVEVVMKGGNVEKLVFIRKI